MTQTFVLDTNVFNWMVEGKFDRAQLPIDAEFVVSHTQIEEINNCSDSNKERRMQLLLQLAELRPTLVPTETLVWDVSRWDHAKQGDGGVFTSIKDALDSRNKGRKSNVYDALIGEVAIANAHTLVTADADLASVVSGLGGKVFHVTSP